MLESMVRIAVPWFVLFVLLGLAIWKIWRGASPLWASSAGAVGAFLLLRADHHYVRSEEPAAIAAAAFAAFCYLEWRAAHRPAPEPWPRRRVISVAAALVLTTATLAGTLAFLRGPDTSQQARR